MRPQRTEVRFERPDGCTRIGRAHATSRVGYIRVRGRNYNDWFRKEAPVGVYDAYQDSLERCAEPEPAGELNTGPASFIDCGTLKG